MLQFAFLYGQRFCISAIVAEAQALVIKFNMAQISKEIEVEVEYGQNYGANEIIYLFEQALASPSTNALPSKYGALLSTTRMVAESHVVNAFKYACSNR